MTTTSYCPQDDTMPKAWCAHCRDLKLPSARPTFLARYEGRCRACNAKIFVGDEMGKADDHTARCLNCLS